MEVNCSWVVALAIFSTALLYFLTINWEEYSPESIDEYHSVMAMLIMLAPVVCYASTLIAYALTLGVVLQGLGDHQWAQIRAANANVDHVLDGLASVAEPCARDHL